MTPHNIPWPITTTTEAPACRALYPTPRGVAPGARIIRCDLPAGHPGEHEEADTEVTWLDPTDPLGMGGLRPKPLSTLTPPTLRDVLLAARRARCTYGMGKVIVGDEHQWYLGDICVTFDPHPLSLLLSVSRNVGTKKVYKPKYRLHAWLDPDEERPLIAQALGHLAAAGIDVPGVTP